jgi:penicillin-binding protein 1A
MKVAKQLIPVLLALGASGVIVGLAIAMGSYYYLAPGLPSADTIRDVKLQVPLRIYTRDGRLIEQFGERRRQPVPFELIPQRVSNAFLAAEDDRFYDHPGFDYQGIARAAFNLMLTGSRSQGGSTITQQLARAYFLTRDRTFVRKGKELILALQIEQEFTKPEILALYLNKIFLGQRAYGVAAAAQVYFGKDLNELNVAEAATLAGLPKAPSTLNPVTNPARAIERRAYVLRRMWELKYIDTETYQAALNFPMVSKLHGSKVELAAPYVASMASKAMLRRFGQDEAYTGGYKVVTTIDSRLQQSAQSALRKTLLEYDQRHGFKGPLAVVDLNAAAPSLALETAESAGDTPAMEIANQALQALLENYPAHNDLSLAVVLNLNADNSADVFIRDTGRARVSWENMKRSRYIDDNSVGDEPKKIADVLKQGSVIRLISDSSVQAEKGGQNYALPQRWRLAQMPEVQGAIVSMDPYDGAITSLAGGFDYEVSKFNRASQAKRQPGSAIKPFIYSAALENGFTAATIVKDAPIVVNDKNLEAIWRPENYSGKFYGDTRLREGLVRSMNLVSLQTLRRVGIGNAVAHLSRFGFPNDRLPRDLTLALGSGAVSMLDLVGGYSGIASGGHYISPYIIERIEDVNGNVVYQADPAVACHSCRDHWFDGRETLKDAAEDYLSSATQKPDEPILQARVDGGDSESWFASGETTLPPVDAEVPFYSDTEQMINSGGSWHPDASETPAFFANINSAPRIISPDNAYIVYDMMRDVVKRGTGSAIRELQRDDLAGKTGTTNEGKDTWFAGFNREIAATVWVGFDNPNRSLGRRETGSKTALPMWKYFIRAALNNQPPAAVPPPANLVTVRISGATGELANAGDSNTRFEIFAAGTEPTVKRGDNGSITEEHGNDDDFDAGDIF